MWAYLILGVILLVIGILIAHSFTASSASTIAKVLKWAGIGLAIVLAVFLAVTGKIHLSLIPLALTVLPSLLSRLSRAGMGGGRPSTGRTSQVETQYLRMSLDHDSGELKGQVLNGRYAGKPLDELSLAELCELLAECQQNDAQSAQLLEAYLDRTQGAAWRQQAGAQQSQAEGSSGAPFSRIMTIEEAREILGVGPGASPDEIKEAHRRLMMKLHPDQGGSTYLASKINQAKEVLLKS